MKNATIKFLLPNAFPISKTGFYNEIGLWRSCGDVIVKPRKPEA